MQYKIQDFSDFLSVYNERNVLTSEQSIEKINQFAFGSTFCYFIPSIAQQVIINEIQSYSNSDILFYGTGNGIWIKNLNISFSFSIQSELKELNTFVKYIMPEFNIKDDLTGNKYDLVIIANADLDLFSIINGKLKPNGRIIFIASESFISEQSNLVKRNIIKNYLSINKIFEIGSAWTILGNLTFLPFINVKHYDNLYLVSVDLPSSNFIDKVNFYFNSHVKSSTNSSDEFVEVAINNIHLNSFSIDYFKLGYRWDYRFNLPSNFKKRIEIEKNGGLLFGNLCDKILEGVKFYYDSKFISSTFNGLKIIGEFDLKDFIKDKEGLLIKSKQNSKTKIGRRRFIGNIEGVPFSYPKTDEIWKVELSIVHNGDILLTRTRPYRFYIVDKSKSGKFIINNELILLRSKAKKILKEFLKSKDFIEQVGAYCIDEKLEVLDLMKLYVPYKYLKVYNTPQN